MKLNPPASCHESLQVKLGFNINLKSGQVIRVCLGCVAHMGDDLRPSCYPSQVSVFQVLWLCANW